MLALSDRVSVELIQHIGLAIVALITLAGIVYQNRKTRSNLKTGNGHTIGEGVARIEETLWRHENRLDSIEVEVREGGSKLDEAARLAALAAINAERAAQHADDHETSVEPLAQWVREKMKEEG